MTKRKSDLARIDENLRLAHEVGQMQVAAFPVGVLVRVKKTGEYGVVEVAQLRPHSYPAALFTVRTNLFCACLRGQMHDGGMCLAFVFHHEIERVEP